MISEGWKGHESIEDISDSNKIPVSILEKNFCDELTKYTYNIISDIAEEYDFEEEKIRNHIIKFHGILISIADVKLVMKFQAEEDERYAEYLFKSLKEI